MVPIRRSFVITFVGTNSKSITTSSHFYYSEIKGSSFDFCFTTESYFYFRTTYFGFVFGADFDTETTAVTIKTIKTVIINSYYYFANIKSFNCLA